MSNSVMAVFSQFATSLIQRHFFHDGDFSIREFINNGTGRLFIVNRIATEESFRGYYSLFLDLAFREFLCRPINRKNRFWFIIDEFPSLMKLETLEKLLAEGRDRGSCPILGAQDFEQVKKNYSPNAYSIFNQTNTKIVFRINDPITLEYLSKAFGEQEIATPVKTLSTSTNRHREGYSFSEQRNVNKLILPSEIKGLQTLKAYVSIGEYPITKLTLDIFKEQGKNVLIPKAAPEITIEFIDDKIGELLS
jgi:type IV secretory pathway TraG/TraD family ATPase VirD4